MSMKKKKTETTSENSTTLSNVNIDNTFGPDLYTRDENGLLKNVQYTFSEDGSINWRAMIGEGNLFPNRGWFDARKKAVPQNTDSLKDHQLLIKLGGIKELARLRGFSDISYEVIKCELDHVAVICRMTFIPNYETHGESVSFQDMANANLQNTSSFATKFLETIACNRAFVRCVRNFLNVHIVGDDEIDKSDPSPNCLDKLSLSPIDIIKKQLNNEDFDNFRNILRELWQQKLYQNESVKEWNKWDDVPAKEARIILSAINKASNL